MAYTKPTEPLPPPRIIRLPQKEATGMTFKTRGRLKRKLREQLQDPKLKMVDRDRLEKIYEDLKRG